MNTEITDISVTKSAGCVFYDGDCAFCRAWLRRIERPLRRRGFRFVRLQSPGVQQRLRLNRTALLYEMKLSFSDGRLIGGADAAVELAHYIWWLWPLWLLSHLPGAMPFFRKGYRIMADNRSCLAKGRSRTARTVWLDWLPLVVLPVLTVNFRNEFENWTFMWLLAIAIFAGCKWLTWRRGSGPATPPLRSLAYLFAWPGMDAEAFLALRRVSRESEPGTSHRRHSYHTVPARTTPGWGVPLTRIVAGTALLGFAARQAGTSPTLLIGWMGMLGVVLILHFGTFELLALLWQRFGLDVKPIMRSPLLATSLGEFWGKRWNTAFNKLAHDFVFRPLSRSLGVRWATLSAFVVSGLIHELVISLPAGAGYGLPTLYFTMQGAAALFERTSTGRSIGLGRGAVGRWFTWGTVAVPACLLFHPPFIHNVILPMLQAIGATGNTP